MKSSLFSMLTIGALSLLCVDASAELARRPTPEIQLGAIRAEDVAAIPKTAPFAPLFVVTCPAKFIVNFDSNTNNAFCQRAITYHATLKCPSSYPTHVYFEEDEVRNLSDRDFCLAANAELKPRSPALTGKARISGGHIDVGDNGLAQGRSVLDEYSDVVAGDGWFIEPPSTNGAKRNSVARFYRTVNLYAVPGYRANP
jgi:hypothetical protein